MYKYRFFHSIAAIAMLGLMAVGCMKSSPGPQSNDAPAAEASTPPAQAESAPSERDPNRLWCNEHGVYEDECVICHPELAKKDKAADARDPARPWCNEHGVYEDECGVCHPELLAAASDDAPMSAGAAELFCNEHGVAERECGICHPEMLRTLRPGEGLKVRFESPQSATKAGVRLGFASESTAPASIDALGELDYDRNKLAVITPLAKGVIQRIHGDLGDRVEAGQVLVEITAPEAAEAKGAYLTALSEQELKAKNLERHRLLVERNVAAQQGYDQAQAEYAAAQSAVGWTRQRLLNLGLTEAEADDVAKSLSTDSTLFVRAPFDGTVVERDSVVGTLVEPGAALFQIADLGSMWMQLSIPESELSAVEAGIAVRAEFDARPGIAFEGELTWVGTSIDETTRMLEARAIISNDGGQLKRGMFGTARIESQLDRRGLSVPEEAVQILDGMPVIFARLEDDLYETRRIQPGPKRDGQIPILDGITAADQLVMQESYVLKSELLKARLGAGCVDH